MKQVIACVGLIALVATVFLVVPSPEACAGKGSGLTIGEQITPIQMPKPPPPKR